MTGGTKKAVEIGPFEETTRGVYYYRPVLFWNANAIILTMNEIFSDASPEIAVLQRDLVRPVGFARILTMLGEMNKTVKALALSGLRSRYRMTALICFVVDWRT
jgi:hypothetical protein